MDRPFSLYAVGQHFQINHPHTLFTEEEIRSAPRPRVAIISNSDDWIKFDRTGMDLVIYWTTEPLGLDRARGKRVVPLSDRDRIYSNCIGPDSKSNLNFWPAAVAKDYRPITGVYRRLIPDMDIKNHAMLAMLGSARLARCYAYLRMLDLELDKNNMISFISKKFYWGVDPDDAGELPGQQRISFYVKNNFDRLPKNPLRLELDWRRLKGVDNFYSLNSSKTTMDAMLMPTKAINACSLIYTMETLLYNPEFVFTEKSGKTLISGRAWIMVGGRHHLSMLREMGFRTMEGIVDESYDSIYDVCDRINHSLNSAKKFMDKDLLSDAGALNEIREISLHNRRNLFDNDWEVAMKKAEAELLDEINSIKID